MEKITFLMWVLSFCYIIYIGMHYLRISIILLGYFTYQEVKESCIWIIQMVQEQGQMQLRLSIKHLEIGGWP